MGHSAVKRVDHMGLRPTPLPLPPTNLMVAREALSYVLMNIVCY